MLLPYLAGPIGVDHAEHLIEAVLCEVWELQEVLQETLGLPLGESPGRLLLCTLLCIVVPNLTHDFQGGVEDAVFFLYPDVTIFANLELKVSLHR